MGNEIIERCKQPLILIERKQLLDRGGGAELGSKRVERAYRLLTEVRLDGGKMAGSAFGRHAFDKADVDLAVFLITNFDVTLAEGREIFGSKVLADLFVAVLRTGVGQGVPVVVEGSGCHRWKRRCQRRLRRKKQREIVCFSSLRSLRALR